MHPEILAIFAEAGQVSVGRQRDTEGSAEADRLACPAESRVGREERMGRAKLWSAGAMQLEGPAVRRRDECFEAIRIQPGGQGGDRHRHAGLGLEFTDVRRVIREQSLRAVEVDLHGRDGNLRGAGFGESGQQQVETFGEIQTAGPIDRFAGADADRQRKSAPMGRQFFPRRTDGPATAAEAAFADEHVQLRQRDRNGHLLQFADRAGVPALFPDIGRMGQRDDARSRHGRARKQAQRPGDQRERHQAWQGEHGRRRRAHFMSGASTCLGSPFAASACCPILVEA